MMVKIKKILLSTILGIAVLLGTAIPSIVFAEETDTNTINITSVDDFNSFLNELKTQNAQNMYSGKTIKLCADIDISTITITSNDYSNATFAGTFDGQGYTISNVHGLQLFTRSLTKTAEIKNLTIAMQDGYTADASETGVFTKSCSGKIDKCIVKGTVNGNNPVNTTTRTGLYSFAFGGFAYSVSKTGSIADCASELKITSGPYYDTRNASANEAYGVVRSVVKGGSVTNCMFTGQLIQGGKATGYSTVMGPISLNSAPGTITGCYYLDSVFDESSSINKATNHGTSKTDTELKEQSTFEGWDFDTVWTMSDNGYPVLRKPVLSEINKAGLQSAVSAAEAKDQSSYTAETWTAMQTELTKAKAVLNADTMTQAQVDAETNALTQALSSLKEVVKTTALETALTQARGYVRGDYTNKSYAALKQNIVSAQTLLNNATLTQDAVNTQTTALQSAIDGLTTNRYTSVIEISTPDQFVELVQNAEDKNYYQDTKIDLTADIDLSQANLRQSLKLYGTFDGMGHTISGINNPQGALFSYVGPNGAIINLNVKTADGLTLSKSEPATVDYAILIQRSSGIISGCQVTGSVTMTGGSLDTNNAVQLSGIASEVDSAGYSTIIENCVDKATLTLIPDNYIADGFKTAQMSVTGIAGRLIRNCIIDDCLTLGTVNGPNAYPVTAPLGSDNVHAQATGCYYAEIVASSLTNYTQGTALTVDGLKTQASYANWNFNSAWKMGSTTAELQNIGNTAVDKTALSQTITAAKATAYNNFNVTTWTAFQTAITSAQSVLDNNDATQVEADRAVAELVNTSANLAQDIDTTALKEAIIKGDAIQAAGIGNKTPASYKAVLTALQAAKDAYANPGQYKLQADLDAVTKSLTEANNGLAIQTYTDTISISNREDFAAFIANVKNNSQYTSNKQIVLKADIDISGLMDNYNDTINLDQASGIHLQGIFDGAGHTLSGYDGNRGLFYVESTGKVENLTLQTADNYQVACNTYNDWCYYGGVLASQNNGAVTDCQVKGSVTFISLTNNSSAGTLSVFGRNTGTNGIQGLMENCYCPASGTILYTVRNNYAVLDAFDADIGWVLNCVANGKLTAENTIPVSETSLKNRVQNTYYDAAMVTDTSAVAYGTAKTSAELADAAQYTGWDANLWDMEAMPSLKNLSGTVAAVDKSELDKQITAAEALVESDYSPESWATLSSTLGAAKEISQRSSASYKEVSTQTSALTASMNALSAITADKTDLLAQLAMAKVIIDNGNADAVYTEESYTALVTAVSNAQPIADNSKALKSQVEAETAALNAALSGLKLTQKTGDVNNDGKVDEVDASLVLRYSANLVELTDVQKKAADVDNNNAVDETDASLILRYSAGLIEAFN